MNYIIIIQPNITGLELIIAAKNTGNNVLVLSAQSGDRLVNYNQFANIITVDTNNYNEIRDKLELIVQNGHKLVSILPGFEFYVVTAALLSYHFGLVGLSPKLANNVRNKYEMRNLFNKVGINSPQSLQITSILDDEIFKSIKYPAVIKPSAAAGSVNVIKVNNINEAKTAYSNIIHSNTTDMDITLGDSALIEEYIDGEEFSVEGYIADAYIAIVSITKKSLGPLPFFVERGHTVTNVITEDYIFIKQWVIDSIKKLGINNTIFHFELRIQKNSQITAIEIGCRLPGDRIKDLIKRVYNLDLAEIAVDISMGNTLKWKQQFINKLVDNQLYVGIRYSIVTHGTRKIPSLNILKKIAKNIPQIKEIGLCSFEGSLISATGDFRSREYFAIIESNSFFDIETAWNKFTTSLNSIVGNNLCQQLL